MREQPGNTRDKGGKEANCHFGCPRKCFLERALELRLGRTLGVNQKKEAKRFTRQRQQVIYRVRH